LVALLAERTRIELETPVPLDEAVWSAVAISTIPLTPTLAVGAPATVVSFNCPRVTRVELAALTQNDDEKL
jgi:hypothetical protein